MNLKYNEWHLRDAEAAAAQLRVDTARGLDEKEVQRRRRKNGRNTIWYIRHSRGSEYAASAAGDLISFLLVIAAVTAAVFEGSEVARSVCAILAAGVILRTLTYVKARRILEELADEGIPSATVIRSGSTQVLRADELVEGDIVLLGPGDIVPCDGRIFLGDGIKVIERGITENKTTVIKGDTVILTDSGKEVPCEFRVNMLFAGSTVIAGRCRIIATACGEDALVSMKHGGLLVPSGEKLPITDILSGWSRRVRLVLLGMVVFISVLSLFTMGGDSSGFAEAFTDAVALAASSAAGYLFLSGYISITIPLRRIACGEDTRKERQKSGEKGRRVDRTGDAGEKLYGQRKLSVRSIVRNAADIEAVAGVRCLIAADSSVFKSGRSIYSSYFIDGSVHDAVPGDRSSEKLLSAALTSICVGSGFGASGAAMSSDGSAERGVKQIMLENGAEEFFRRSSQNGQASSDWIKASIPSVIDHVREDDESGGTDTVLFLQDFVLKAQVSGDLRTVLSYCDSAMKKGTEVFLTQEERAQIVSAAEKIEARGGTVIALAERQSPYNSLRRLSVIHSKMCFMGFVAFDEDAEDGIEEAAGLLDRSGMRVVLLSSSPVKDKNYLEKYRIYNGTETIISCKEVLGGRIPEGSFVVWVPASFSPSDKVDAALKMRTAVVRKLSDCIFGVSVITSEPNEAAMMTERAVGSAVSRSFNRPIPQTLKRLAKISVYPPTGEGCGGFLGTVKAIAASVCALENLRRAAVYALISQGAKAACTILSVAFGGGVISSPTLLFSGMIFDFLSVLAISFGRERKGALDGNVSERKIPSLKEAFIYSGIGALAGGSEFGLVLLGGLLIHGSSGEISASLSIIILLTQLIFLTEAMGGRKGVSRRDNMVYPTVFILAALTAILIVVSESAASFFGGAKPSWQMLIISLVPSALIAAVFELNRKFRRKHS